MDTEPAVARQADRHKRTPIPWRPKEELETALKAHAAARGESVSALLTRAVTMLLAEEAARNP
jgi:hypothetical protein